jgi:hypothetical protein
MWLAAKTATSCSVWGCWRRHATTGCPPGVVCTAATKGVCSLGQITNALFEVGGQYRRSM